MIEKYDITLYKSENFDVLKYCYENYASHAYVKELIKRMSAALEENYDMHESVDSYDSVGLIEISLCRCQNWQISGRGSRTVRLRIEGNRRQGHDVYPGSGPLDGGNTLLPA